MLTRFITTTALCRATELRARRLIDTPIDRRVSRDLEELRRLHRSLTRLLNEYDPETRVMLSDEGREELTDDRQRRYRNGREGS